MCKLLSSDGFLRFPFTCLPFRFRDLGRRQMHGGESVPEVAIEHLIVTGRTCCRKIKPHMSLQIIERQAQPAHGAHAHFHPTRPVFFQRVFLEPAGRFHVVTGYSQASGIQKTEEGLGIGISLRRGLPSPLGRRPVVLGQPFSLM